MGVPFTFCSWNIKGMKTKDKSRVFWDFVKQHKEILVWNIQEHHLDAFSFRRSGFLNYLAFYADAPNGFSGVFSLVNRDLSPSLVFAHPSGRRLLIKICFEGSEFLIINVYGDNLAKSRACLWDAMATLDLDLPFVMAGDFNMVLNLLTKKALLMFSWAGKNKPGRTCRINGL